MFNVESLRFWINVAMGNLGIYTLLLIYNTTFDSIKKNRINNAFFALVAICAIFFYGIVPREMDIPGLMALRHNEMEGVVCDFSAEQEATNGRMNWFGGTIDVIDDDTGKIFHFRDVRVPSKLCIDDRVSMLYLKHYRMGAVVEINGEEVRYRIDNNKPFGVFLILSLLVSVPFYYLWMIKIKPFFHYKKDYAVYIHRELYIRGMKVLYLIIMLGAAVLLTAVLGYYKTSWDILWGVVLLAGYLGVLGVSYLHQKRFVIMDGQFYYYCGTRENWKRSNG